MKKLDEIKININPEKEEEIKKKIKPEAEKTEKSLRPPPPGELINDKLAGKKLERKCSVKSCLGQLEELYIKNISLDLLGPQRYYWKYKNTRCSSCGLMYDLDGLI